MHRILVVDDECLVADTLVLIFRRSGFEARAAYSARTALDSARSFPPDILLCDITMPERGGIELMADIDRELPACHFLVLTGYYANVLRVQQEAVRLERPAHVLTKPCHPSKLLREAREILSQRGINSGT